ncbi:MAG: flagellar basal body-associated protein FliL [Shewanella sp.]
MAKEAALELENIESPKSKKKLYLLIGGGVLVALLIGLGAWMLLSGGDKAPETEATQAAPASADMTLAVYVPMPRPFLFNLPGQERARLVEIKVQLMVRGPDDGVLTQKHIPLIEDALLTTFSGADVQKLSTQAGKDELRQLALQSVQNTLQPITGRKVVEKVLFTGFVMQ